jgi:hypothetical protein
MLGRLDSYEITCPCGHSVPLSARDFGWMDTLMRHDDGQCAPIDYLCEHCKTAFTSGYDRPSTVAQVDIPLAPLGVVITMVDCGADGTLFLVRSKGTTAAQTNAEIEQWLEHKPRHVHAGKTRQVSRQSTCLCPKE